MFESCSLGEDGVDAVALGVVGPLAAPPPVQTPRARRVAVLLRVACKRTKIILISFCFIIGLVVDEHGSAQNFDIVPLYTHRQNDRHTDK